MAKDEARHPRERILAAAAAFGSFAECGVVNAVHDARRHLDEADLAASTLEIERIAPGLLAARHVEGPGKDRRDAAPHTSADPSPTMGHGRVLRPPTVLATVASSVRRGGLNIVAPFEAASGEGGAARLVATALRRHGVAIATSSYHAEGRSHSVKWSHRGPSDHPFDTTLLVLAPHDIANFVIDHGAAAFEGRYMIAAWLWDFERPSGAMSTAARMVHEIWVPSLFAAGAVARATDRRVARMVLPIELEPSVGDVPREAATSAVHFLARVDYDTGFERQNPLGVVEAFRLAFPLTATSRLMIETIHEERFPAEHSRLMQAVADRTDIEVHRAGAAAEEWPPGSAGASCFVSLHRSEGTGFALARAMAKGIPTIVTRHSFSTELQGSHDSFQVPCSLAPVPSTQYQVLPGARWAIPDLEAAASAMRQVAAQPVAAARRAKRAQELARREFSPARSVRAITDRLTALERVRYGGATRSALAGQETSRPPQLSATADRS